MTALARVVRAGSVFAFVGGLFGLGWLTCFLSGVVAGKGSAGGAVGGA